jgi:hypothetical protein
MASSQKLLECCGPQGRELLWILCYLIHDRECIPHGLRNGILVSVPQSGDLTNCASYRGLTLRHTVIKLSHTCCYSKCALMSSFMTTSTVAAVGGTADALFALDGTVCLRMQRGKPTCLFLLEKSKAYDREFQHAFLIALLTKGCQVRRVA